MNKLNWQLPCNLSLWQLPLLPGASNARASLGQKDSPSSDHDGVLRVSERVQWPRSTAPRGIRHAVFTAPDRSTIKLEDGTQVVLKVAGLTSVVSSK